MGAQARVMDVAKVDGKLDTEYKNRKEEIESIKTWYSPENDTRKVEIEDLKKVTDKENEARKEAIDKLEAFVKAASINAVSDLDGKMKVEVEARAAEDLALGDRITEKLVTVREKKMSELVVKTEKQNDERVADIEKLRRKVAVDSQYLESLAKRTMGVYFSAYRTGAYSGGGENLTLTEPTATTGEGWTLSPGYSLVLSGEPTCSSSTSPHTITRKLSCPSKSVIRRSPLCSTRTTRTTTRTAWRGPMWCTTSRGGSR